MFTKRYELLWQVTDDTVRIMRRLLDVNTPLVYESELKSAGGKKSEFLIGLLRQLGADEYLSGAGARKYMDMDMFARAGIRVRYQNFVLPEYPQKNASSFVPGISALDILFNCGIEGTRKIFWENVSREQENET